MHYRMSKLLIVLVVVTFCCLTLVHSLKCYTCSSVKDCKKPQLLECNYNLANQTKEYLNFYYTGLPNATSYGFECMSDWLKITSGEMAHRGCIYNNLRSCTYTIRPYLSQNHQRSCKQCHTDKCNPADRASGSVVVVVITALSSVLAKYL